MIKTHNRHGYDLSTSPSLGRMRRAVASLLGLLVLLFNVAGAGAMPAPGADSPLSLALSEGRIIICTAAGMVVLNSDGTPAQSGVPAHDTLCAYCLPLMHGGAAAAQPVAMPAAPVNIVLAQAAPTALAAPLAAGRQGAWTARAPPAL